MNPRLSEDISCLGWIGLLKNALAISIMVILVGSIPLNYDLIFGELTIFYEVIK